MQENYSTFVTGKFQSWVLASRPKTLLAAVVPVVVGSSLAIGKDNFQILYSIIALACSLLIQIGTNFVNDLYDYLKGADNEKRKGPTRVLASGLISVKEMRIGIFITFSLSFLLGLILVYKAGIVILIIGVLSILAGIAYTAGPFPLAYKGLGDIFVFIFFGIIGTTFTYYVFAKEFTLISFLASIPVGALITNILVINNYRDIDEDRLAGKITLAVILGKNLTRVQFLLQLAASFIVPVLLFFLYDFKIWILLPLLSLPLAIKLVNMLYLLDGFQLNKALEITAKFSAIFGLLFSVGLAFR
jgi:1,4-dihydroxy-2-naphthoate octaprenyltransferase